MKILVTGATGFIGKQVLLLMRERGHEVVVLTRDSESAGVRLPIACKVFAWDPMRSEPPAEALHGVDAIVNLAGENIAGGRWTQARKTELFRSRILSTSYLVQAIGKLGTKPRVFVSASAVGIYGNRGAEELEESSARGAGTLADLCQGWEDAIFKAETLGVRTVALRIGVVLGKEGGAMKMMLPPFRLGLGGPLGDGRQWMSWVHVRDVAGLILHAIENETVSGTINAVSPNPVTNREFTRMLAAELRRPAVFRVPAVVLRIVFGEMADLLLDSQKVSAGKARGYQFLYPRLNTALREVCNHFNHEFLMEQWVPLPVEQVFPFFSDAKNLEVLTPKFLGFRIIGQSTKNIEKGTRIDYRLKLYGIPFHWQSLVMDWRPNAGFSDSQTRGPYSIWFHTHEFIKKNGGTILRDRIVYKVRFGVIGDILAHCFVRANLNRIFMFRRKKADELFGGTRRSLP